jgi:hypothetical protein
MKTNTKMTPLVKRIEFIIILLGFVSCNSSISEKEKNAEIPELKQDLTNKREYNIKVGDTLKIYHGSQATACDFICAPNIEALNHLVYIGDNFINTGQPEGCAGCWQIYALTFVARSTGSDTVIQKNICFDTPCSDTLTGFDEHIINIK